jgi:hypothetical protein
LEVDAEHQAACEKMASNKDMAYYTTGTVKNTPPASGEEIKKHFELAQYTSEVKTACGSFDLLLLTSRTPPPPPPQATVAGRAAEAVHAAKTVRHQVKNAVGEAGGVPGP